MITVPSHVELTVVRPNGSTEVVKHPSFTEISESTFKKMQEATKKAGKGNLVAYKNCKKEVADYVMSAADKATDSTSRIEKMMAYGE